MSRGNTEGSFGILSVQINIIPVLLPENTAYLISVGEGVYMVTHLSLRSVYFSIKDMHTNKHSALSSCALVAVFLLAGCLCFAPRQHRGGDALCNPWCVPGIYRESERKRDEEGCDCSNTHTHI